MVGFLFNGKQKAQQNCINLHKSELVESVHHLCFLAVLDCSPFVELKW